MFDLLARWRKKIRIKQLAAPLLVRGWGAKHSLSSPTLRTFRNFGRSKTNSMKSEIHSTALCKRITNCNSVAMSYQLQTPTHKAAVNSFRTQLFWKHSLPRSGGRNAAGTSALQKSIKAPKPNKCMKHTADSGALLLCFHSPLRSKQKAKSGAARKRGAARGRHSNWPPRAEEKTQNAEIHKFKQLCETALGHYVLKGSFQSDCIPGNLI